MTTKWKDYEVFGSVTDERHVCCDCCEDYCPRIEDGATLSEPHVDLDVDLYSFTFHGREYVTDRYVAVLASMVEIADQDSLIVARTGPAVTIPAVKPPTSTAALAAPLMHRLTLCGIDITEGDANNAPQHLYHDNEHIGWLMPLKTKEGRWAPTIADLDDLRSIAADLPIWENGQHPLETAARLLRWEKDRAGR